MKELGKRIFEKSPFFKSSVAPDREPQKETLDPETAIYINQLTAGYGKVSLICPWEIVNKKHAVIISDSDNLRFPRHKITAIMGPNGSGKSTLLRAINRIHEITDETYVGYVDGEIIYQDDIGNPTNIYDSRVDTMILRRRIGMVFQQPNLIPFSIDDNVRAGLKLWGEDYPEAAEKYLRLAGLWDEVKDRLNDPAKTLSGGQQQRLCIARTLAVNPEVLLLDEPCSSLDPGSTSRIEDLLRTLSGNHTIILVTHNLHQAARVSDMVAFLMPLPKAGSKGLAAEGDPGRFVEFGNTREIFTNPKNRRTEDFITGRVG